MAYSVDLRMAAVKHYLESGDACAETGKIFGIGGSTVQNWVQRYEETGDLSDKPLKRGHKKLPPEQLCAYVRQHSDATQQEIADAFGCSNQAVGKALKRPAITRKKDAPLQGTRRGESDGLSGNAGDVPGEKAPLCR